ncbi:hypothetical protein [Peribacillus frigoritolerans]|uniref:Uncharacterized protein n=1 Tax=Peribacillus castrilensis TaxID=2897690 RepID=A0AAW9NHM2_9BACI|nr:hypothetical protein [Peribacillus castrilensis]
MENRLRKMRIVGLQYDYMTHGIFLEKWGGKGVYMHGSIKPHKLFRYACWCNMEKHSNDKVKKKRGHLNGKSVTKNANRRITI